MNFRLRTHWRRIGLIGSVILTPLLLILAVLVASQSQANASSHREAPLISKDPLADNTDTYLFISPENNNNIVFVGSWIPFEGPEGAPNYFAWDDSALYDIYVDNNGDAKADITYTLSSRSSVANPLTFLYNTGPINSITDAAWNERQYITITEHISGSAATTLVGNKLTTPSNIGSKSTPNYTNLENQAIYPILGGTGKVYAGQTDDPFWVDLQVFDLVTLRGQQPPIGYTEGTNIPVDSVSAFNVHSLVIEVPITHVTKAGEPVIGMWSGTRRQTTRVFGALGTQSTSGDYVQVSRLGMPLTNEVVIPLALKDAFNNLRPENDLDIYLHPTFGPILQKSVENPEIGILLCTLYKVALPEDTNDDCNTEFTTPGSGRGDIFQIFLTGMKLAKPFTIITSQGAGGTAKPLELPAGFNVNQPAGARPADMLRINTAIKGDLCMPASNPARRLGVVGGDACGFPNGRRLIDDIVEIELLAVAGAAYQPLDGQETGFAFNAGLIDVLDDGIDKNDIPFRNTFPYLAQAQSGQMHWHTNPFFDILLPWVMKN